jgi:hypothetical protein
VATDRGKIISIIYNLLRGRNVNQASSVALFFSLRFSAQNHLGQSVVHIQDVDLFLPHFFDFTHVNDQHVKLERFTRCIPCTDSFLTCTLMYIAYLDIATIHVKLCLNTRF